MVEKQIQRGNYFLTRDKETSTILGLQIKFYWHMAPPSQLQIGYGHFHIVRVGMVATTPKYRSLEKSLLTPSRKHRFSFLVLFLFYLDCASEHKMQIPWLQPPGLITWVWPWARELAAWP